MYRIRLLLLLSLILQASIGGHAQNSKVDSLQQALRTARPDSNKVTLLLALSDAYAYPYRKSRIDSALIAGRSAKSLSDQISYTYGQLSATEKQARAYMLKLRVDSATVLYRQVLPAAIQYGDAALIADIEFGLGACLVKRGHTSEGRKYLYSAIENARKRKKSDAESRQQQMLFALVLLVLLGAAVFGFYTYRQRQERRRTELELASLRAQINPHFIFNCLNSIYRYTKERDTDTAAKYLQKFSSLLRLVLENSRTEKITLARDLEALQLYVDIEALRFKEKLQYSLETDPDIDPTFLQIPGMLIQPHIENAIWHGLMHRREGGHIRVRLTQPAENLLRVEIEDDGIGRAAAAELESKSALTKKSLGQKITAERLRATGKLAHTETIDLTSANGNAAGTKVVMEIPL